MISYFRKPGIFLSFGLVFIFAISSYFISSCTRSEKPTVAITQIVSHPSLDEIRKGIIEALDERGYRDGKNIEIIYRNANGDPSLTLPIAQDFVRKKVNIIVPITTPSALGAAKSTKSIPIIFGAVTDPVGVGLVPNLERPEGNITGTSDRWPIEKQIQLFKKLLPGLQRLGMIFRPGDDVSKIGVDTVQTLSSKYGFEVELAPCSDPGQVYSTAI